jgi:hypothetical protein
MSLDELKKQFIVSEDTLKERLEAVVAKALKRCRIDESGQVLIMDSNLPGKDQVKLTLAARALAAQLDVQIAAEVTVLEISKYTGLPANQVRARGKDAIRDKFAESPAAGVYRAIPKKIEAFLDSIPELRSRTDGGKK